MLVRLVIKRKGKEKYKQNIRTDSVCLNHSKWVFYYIKLLTCTNLRGILFSRNTEKSSMKFVSHTYAYYISYRFFSVSSMTCGSAHRDSLAALCAQASSCICGTLLSSRSCTWAETTALQTAAPWAFILLDICYHVSCDEIWACFRLFVMMPLRKNS